jgi:hypothetical protein
MSSKTAADKISQAEARLSAIQAERSQIDTREPQVQARAEQISTRDLPAAKQAHSVARISADPKDDLPAAKKVVALKTELANCESTLAGFEIRRQQLAIEEAAARTSLERAKARKELDQVTELGKAAEGLFADAFEVLGELVAGSVRPAIEHLNRDDRRGIVAAFDESALARWFIGKCSQAGVTIRREDLGLMHLAGTGPADTAANVVTVVETL